MPIHLKPCQRTRGLVQEASVDHETLSLDRQIQRKVADMAIRHERFVKRWTRELP